MSKAGKLGEPKSNLGVASEIECTFHIPPESYLWAPSTRKILVSSVISWVTWKARNPKTIPTVISK